MKKLVFLGLLLTSTVSFASGFNCATTNNKFSVFLHGTQANWNKPFYKEPFDVTQTRNGSTIEFSSYNPFLYFIFIDTTKFKRIIENPNNSENYVQVYYTAKMSFYGIGEMNMTCEEVKD